MKYPGNPCFVRDYIQTQNSIDLKVNQYTIYVTYGITRHLDFSAAIPFSNVQMKCYFPSHDCAQFRRTHGQCSRQCLA